MIKCPNCTGELDFDVKDQVVKCTYCGSEFNPKEAELKLKTAKAIKQDKKTEEKEENEETKKEEKHEEYEGKGYSCTQCGATLMTFDETAITFCSYCGSQAMIEEKMIKIDKPEYIIPFQKTKEECINAYKSKVSKSLFAPSYLKSSTTLEKFRGIFMPYVIYKLDKDGNCTFKGSKYSHRSGDYQIYDDYTIDANVNASYKGISYDLLSKYYDKYSDAIPFNYKKAEEFNPNYMVSFYADAGDVPATTYDNDVTNTVARDTTRFLSKYKEFRKYGCSNPQARLDVSERKVGMFPVYFLAVRDKKDKVYYAVVNGQTGKVAADIPISFGKYVIGSLILAVIIFLLINNLFILTPLKVTIFTIIASIFSTIATISQSSNINSQQNHLDDLGYMSIEENRKKKKVNVGTFKYIYKELIAVAIPIIVAILHPVSDVYYYAADFISLALVVLSFKDLINEHNILVSNRLPQLEKRGGDEK